MLEPLLDYSWNNTKNIRKIDIDLTCEEYGFKGRGCIGILTKNGLPAEEIEILSKDVEIDGEIYTLASNIKYKINSGWVEEDFAENLQELLLSERVLWTKGNTKLPIRINTKSINKEKNINNKKINYSLEFEMAFDVINNVI